MRCKISKYEINNKRPGYCWNFGLLNNLLIIQSFPSALTEALIFVSVHILSICPVVRYNDIINTHYIQHFLSLYTVYLFPKKWKMIFFFKRMMLFFCDRNQKMMMMTSPWCFNNIIYSVKNIYTFNCTTAFKAKQCVYTLLSSASALQESEAADDDEDDDDDEEGSASSQSVRAVAARADEAQVTRLVLFQQSRDFLVVGVRIQRFVIFIIFIILVSWALLHLLRLRVVLLFSRGHLSRVPLSPFSSSVLKPDLRQRIQTREHHIRVIH